MLKRTWLIMCAEPVDRDQALRAVGADHLEHLATTDRLYGDLGHD